MARSAYIKPNSSTQKYCTSSQQNLNKILEVAKLTHDQWIALMFETGWQLAHNQVKDEKLRASLLYNKKFGYWAWFIWVFIEDDAKLLSGNIDQRDIEARYGDFKYELAKYLTIDFEGDLRGNEIDL